MYSIIAVYALPFWVASMPAVRCDLNGGLPMCLWYDSLYIRIKWLLVFLWNLCKPDMVLVSIHVKYIFFLSLRLVLNLQFMMNLRIRLALLGYGYPCIKYGYLRHGWLITFHGFIWRIITYLSQGQPSFAQEPSYQSVVRMKMSVKISTLINVNTKANL